MPWLTISIDLCGSTKVKQALVESSSGNAARRQDLYDEYLKILYATEREFYTRLLARDRVDFEKLFLVKAIGDEFWYMYEVPEDSAAIVDTSCDILIALLELCGQERHLNFGALDSLGDLGRDTQAETLPAKWFDIPVKVCIDLLIEPIEMTNARYEFLKDIAFLAEGGRSAVYKVDEEFLAYCNRLNLAAPSPFQKGRSLTTRQDFIGLEVDRFFRLAAFCLPKMVGIGDTLFSCLSVRLSPAERGLEHLPTKLAEVCRGKNPDEPPDLRGYVISQPVPSAGMKGISGDYALHHLFGADSLGESVFQPPAGIDTLMEPTRAFLGEHGFYALDRTRLVP